MHFHATDRRIQRGLDTNSLTTLYISLRASWNSEKPTAHAYLLRCGDYYTVPVGVHVYFLHESGKTSRFYVFLSELIRIN